MKVLTSFNEFLAKNRKNIIYILGFLVVFFVLSDLTFAGGGETAPSGTNDKDKNQVISALNEALKAISVVLTLGTNLVGWFLYPEWTSGKIIGIDQTLKNLWIMVSNVVYFLFAGIFVWIAFMNIVGKDGDTYELKKAIPRFIIGVLIVPFSWFFVQFIISISNIFTAAVLSLPMTDELYQVGDEKKSDIQVKVCTNGYTIKTGTQKALKNEKDAAKKTGDSAGSNYVVKCEGESKKSLSEVMKGNGIYSVMYFYTFSVMKFDNYGKLFSGDLIKGVNDVINLIFKTGFSIIFIVVYAILVIALGLALFVRILRLWFFALFSPVFGLLYFFKKDGGGDGVVKNFSLKNFISLALVPVYVSAALAFGIIFILTADSGIQKSGLIKQSEDKKSSCVNLLPDTETAKDNSTRVCWDGVYHDENASKSIDAFKGFVGSFGSFLLQIFGIIFLWVGVMAALKSSDITKEVVDPIAKFGDSIGDLMKKAPTYAPIFPGGLSAQGLSKIGNTVQNIPETRLNNKMADTLSKIQNTFGGGNTVDPQTKNKVNQILVNGIDNKDELDQLRKIYLEQVEKYGTNDRNVQELRRQILEAMKNAKGTAENDLKNTYGISDLSKINTDDLKNQESNMLLLGRGKDVNAANKLGTATMPGAITGLIPGSSSVVTLPSTITKEGDKYKVGSTTININNGGVSNDQISLVANALKDVERTKIDDVLDNMGIKNATDISKIQKEIDEIKSKK